MQEELKYILLGVRRIRINVDKGLDLPLPQDQRMMYLDFDLLEV
jgi:hypothetical protein